MRAPKHLWSGDWERESAALSEELASLEELPGVASEPAPPPAAVKDAPASRRGWTWPNLGALRILLPTPPVRRFVAVGFVLLAVLAAAAYGLGAVLGEAQSQSSTTASGGPMAWLGMEVETLAPSGVVVATAPPGSQGERAGLEPGDVIVSIGNRIVNGTSDIAGAISGMHAGQRVPIEVSRGSTPFTTNVTLGAPPSSYP
jgi:hypothetical protein